MPTPRCTLLPLPDHQVSFRVSGVERLRWHFGPHYPRPFFYPLVGPASGEARDPSWFSCPRKMSSTETPSSVTMA